MHPYTASHHPLHTAHHRPCLRSNLRSCRFFFFFNDTATTEIYTLSLHDALPICDRVTAVDRDARKTVPGGALRDVYGDRKSTRLNSSHGYISYAVFCLKKKKKYFTGISYM